MEFWPSAPRDPLQDLSPASRALVKDILRIFLADAVEAAKRAGTGGHERMLAPLGTCSPDDTSTGLGDMGEVASGDAR